MSKWECAVTIWIVALAYLAAPLLASWISRTRKMAAAIAAPLILFPVHTYLPLFGLVSFGKRWYASTDPLRFALLPAILGLAGAIAIASHGGRHADRRRSPAQAQ